MSFFSARSLMAALPDNAILVAVDFNKDFFDLEGSNLPIPGSSFIIQPSNDFLAALWPSKIKAALFTSDSHTEDHVEYQPDGTPFPKHCVKGTAGEALVVTPNIVPRPIPLFRLEKNVFNMWEEPNLSVMPLDIVTRSQFGEMSREAFFQTFKDRGVQDAVVIGVASDICDNFAIRGLLDFGFNVTCVKPFMKGLFREIEQVIAEEYAKEASEGRIKLVG